MAQATFLPSAAHLPARVTLKPRSVERIGLAAYYGVPALESQYRHLQSEVVVLRSALQEKDCTIGGLCNDLEVLLHSFRTHQTSLRTHSEFTETLVDLTRTQ